MTTIFRIPRSSGLALAFLMLGCIDDNPGRTGPDTPKGPRLEYLYVSEITFVDRSPYFGPDLKLDPGFHPDSMQYQVTGHEYIGVFPTTATENVITVTCNGQVRNAYTRDGKPYFRNGLIDGITTFTVTVLDTVSKNQSVYRVDIHKQ